MKTLYLCGAGNADGVRLALRVNACDTRWDRIVLLDDDPAKHGRAVLGVEVVGPFDALQETTPAAAEVVNLVARTTAGRAAARRKIAAYGVPFVGLVDPDVDLMGSDLEGDVIVYGQATIGAETHVSAGCVIFMGARVGQRSCVGPGCVVAPNAVLNSRVRLAEGVYVGTNATILPDLAVGPWATIGANSVAIQDVPGGSTVIGFELLAGNHGGGAGGS